MSPTNIESATIAPQAVDLLLAGAFARGLDVAEVTKTVGLPASWLANVDLERSRVPARVVLALWDDLSRRSGLPHWGLWLAKHLVEHHPSTLGGLLVQSAPTLGDGFRRMLAFERVFHGIELLNLELDDNVARFVHLAPFGAGPGSGPAIDFGFSWLVFVAQRTTGQPVPTLRAQFAHAEPADVGEWTRVFGVRPEFGTKCDVLELPRNVLELPQITADVLIARLAARHAKMLLDALPPISAGESDIEARARAYVSTCITRGEPDDATIAGFAAQEGASPRTVQRRLAERGKSFVEVADEVRNTLAQQYLATTTHAIAEVAFALGFADQTAFHKAFVRWTGVTPGAYRRGARA